MGTSAGTCAVSRLPIHDGDPVVVVTMRKNVKLQMYCDDGDIGTYRVLSALSHLFMYDYMTLEERRGQDFYNEKATFYAERINHRTGQPFTEADIQERVAESIQDKLDSIQRFAEDVVITRGKYNEYSYVVDEQGNKIWDWQNERESVFFMVCAKIWDRLTASTTNQHVTMWKTVEVLPEHMHIERAYVFVHKCYLARLEIIEQSPLFPGDGHNEYWEAQKEIQAVIDAARAAKYQRELEYGWFDEGEDEE
jgi:hypothetical protein